MKMDARNFSVPQTRRRLYGVFINSRFQKRPFVQPMPWAYQVRLHQVLQKRLKPKRPGLLPQHEREHAIVKGVFDKLWKKKIDARKVPVAIDIDASKKFAAFQVDRVPCMLHSRHRGNYVSTLSERLNLEELAMCQGYTVSDVQRFLAVGVPQGKLVAMLGDAVTKPVMAAVVAHALHAIDLIPGLPTERQMQELLSLPPML